jgi:hypothetical protein
METMNDMEASCDAAKRKMLQIALMALAISPHRDLPERMADILRNVYVTSPDYEEKEKDQTAMAAQIVTDAIFRVGYFKN